MLAKLQITASFLLASLILVFGSGSVSFTVAQTGPDDYHENVVVVKFTKEALNTMNRQLVLSEARTSLPSVDLLNEQLEVHSMHQLIRTDPRFAERHARYGLDRWYVVEYASTTDVPSAIAAFKSNANIEHAEPKFQYEILGSPTSPAFSAEELVELLSDFDDPRLDEQWHYHNTGQTGGTEGADMKLFPAWDIETGSSEIIVQVVDTGIDLNHPDLENMLWENPFPGPENGYVDDFHGWNHVSGNSDIQDTNGHGSHCSGTIAAQNNNGVGVAGIAGGNGEDGTGVRIMTSRVFIGAFGGGGFAEAVVYGADNGAVIANHSWGGGGFSQALRDAILYFIENAGYDADGNPSGPIQGGLIVFAAGNSDVSTPNEPIASNPEVMAVASTNHNDQKSWYSQYGDWVHISAPGGETNTVLQEGVLSTVQNGNYQFYQGTSMAAPHAVGVAALVASSFKDEGITPDEIFERLVATTDPIEDVNPSYQGQMGSGRLNAARALEQDDGIAPDAITDLEVIDEAQSSITVEWTATGSSGMEGMSNNVDLRYSTNPITESNFHAAPQPDRSVTPRSAGQTQTFTVSGLQPNTNYYFAVKASDFFGNVSPISNLATGTTAGTPTASVDPEQLYAETEEEGNTVVKNFSISNSGNADLEFAFSGVNVTEMLARPGVELNNVSRIYPDMELEKGEEDHRTGHPVLLGAGGPDEFGYTWIDSNEPGGPAFNWFDISEVGSPIPGLSGTWDGNAMVDLPFDFPFYDGEYSEARVSVNGWIHFGSFSGLGFTNREIPSTSDPTNFLAVLWDDLDMRQAGSVYSYHDEQANRFIVQWDGAPKSGSSGTVYTFQAMLYANGTIVYQYDSITGNNAANTVGIENQDGTDGLQVAFNTGYVESELAVRFATAPDWISLNQADGVVAPGESLEIEATFDPAGLSEGIYTHVFSIGTNVYGGGGLDLPVSFQIGSGVGSLAADMEEMEFGDAFVGTGKMMSIELTNNGTSLVTVNDLGISSSFFSPASDTPLEIAPGLSKRVNVMFSPEAAISYNGVLIITGNTGSGNQTMNIPLSGNGIEPPEAEFSIASDALTIGNDEEESIPFTMSNSGSGTLEFSIAVANANLHRSISERLQMAESQTTQRIALDLDFFAGFTREGQTNLAQFDAGKPNSVIREQSMTADITAFAFGKGSQSAGYAINESGEIIRINVISGSSRTLVSGSSGEMTLSDLAVHPVSGNIITLSYGEDFSRISKLSHESGEMIVSHDLPESMRYITADASGMIYLANASGSFAAFDLSNEAYRSSMQGSESVTLNGISWDSQSGRIFASWSADDMTRLGVVNPASGSLRSLGNTVSEVNWFAFPMSNGAIDWVTADPSEGTIEGGESAVNGSLVVNPDGITPSEYDLVVFAYTNDPAKEVLEQNIRINVQGEPEAYVQLIHNGSHPSASNVDIFIDGEVYKEGMSYRSATPFEWFPAGESVDIAIAPAGSQSVADAIHTASLNLERGENYTIIISGDLNTDGPVETELGFWVIENTLAKSDDEENIAFFFFHGITDAPAVDAEVRSVGMIAEGLDYGMVSDYHYMQADNQIFDFYEAGSSDYLMNFVEDLSMYEGESATVLLSGYMSGPRVAQLIVVLGNGDVLMPTNATSTDDDSEIPVEFALNQNYPNPFNPTTNISYSLPQASDVTIEVFNVQGQRVATLVNGQQSAGNHTVAFDAARLSSGVYLYRIQAGSFVETRKMMLIK